MPRFSKYEHIYVKDRVWFEEFLPVRYRKGKRIVLAFIDYLLKNDKPFTVVMFEYFLNFEWPQLQTVNRPIPYKFNQEWAETYKNNIFDTSEDIEDDMLL